MNQSPQRRRRGRGGRCGHPVHVTNSDAINRAGRSNTNNRTTGRSSSNNTPRSTTAQEGANTKKNDKNHEYTTSTTTSTTSNLSSSSVSKKTKTKKKRTKTTTKRFRKMKVLLMWVLPTLFLIPLFIIVIEYYIGKIISLEDIQDVYVEQMYDPWELLLMDIDKMSDTTTTTTEDSYPDNNNNNFNNNNNNHNNADATAVVSSRSNSFNIVGSLPNISYTVRSKCPQGFRRMINVHNPMSHSNYGKTQQQKRDHSIPMIVHQQSKTRCLTMNVDRYVIYVFFFSNHMIYEITIVTKLSGCVVCN